MQFKSTEHANALLPGVQITHGSISEASMRVTPRLA